jgi:uncharacterized membrane protein HdeD (DUF308 family)
MENTWTRNWWVLALRGAAAILFGLLAFLWPDLTLAALVLLFGAYALWDGVFALFSGIRQRGKDQRWWVMVIQGLVGIGAGILTFLWPGMTALVLVYFIASWAVVTGVLAIVTAIQLRKEIRGEWLLALSGALSVIVGVAMIFLPGAGALALVWLIASYAIALGILMLVLAFRLRSLRSQQSTAQRQAPRGVS